MTFLDKDFALSNCRLGYFTDIQVLDRTFSVFDEDSAHCKISWEFDGSTSTVLMVVTPKITILREWIRDARSNLADIAE